MRYAPELLIFMLMATVTLAEDTKAPDPSQRFTAFITAIKAKDMDATMACLAKLRKVEGLDVESQVKAMMARHMQRLAAAGDAVAVKHEIDGNCAIVVFKDVGPNDRFDYDPCYLIQKDGRWGILPSLTRHDDRAVEMNEEELKRMAQLADWFKAEKKKLREAE